MADQYVSDHPDSSANHTWVTVIKLWGLVCLNQDGSIANKALIDQAYFIF